MPYSQNLNDFYWPSMFTHTMTLILVIHASKLHCNISTLKKYLYIYFFTVTPNICYAFQL